MRSGLIVHRKRVWGSGLFRQYLMSLVFFFESVKDRFRMERIKRSSDRETSTKQRTANGSYSVTGVW